MSKFWILSNEDIKKVLSLVSGLAVIILLVSSALRFVIQRNNEKREPRESKEMSSIDKPSWKKYVDNKHGFSIEIPSDWWGQYWEINLHEVQERFIIKIEDLNPCISPSSYIQRWASPSRIQDIEPLVNPHLNGFVVKKFHLDEITPGSEGMVFNCPNLIRLKMNFSDFQNPEELFDHIIRSMKVWTPILDEQPTSSSH